LASNLFQSLLIAKIHGNIPIGEPSRMKDGGGEKKLTPLFRVSKGLSGAKRYAHWGGFKSKVRRAKVRLDCNCVLLQSAPHKKEE